MRVLGIIINVFFPGIGTIIVGQVSTGVIQFLLYIVGVVLMATGIGVIIGGPIVLVVWVWAIVSAANSQDK